ncbi:hypothetical protein [Pedobacter frigoris]|uniref:hypothetical protein n=1 Tax=Pedobacter frigoris TaxID=2571272 RepID=UPI002930D119|nr:hypothetical protein [Pedobacter frigoris]
MKQVEIMVVCCQEEILKTIVRLINNNPTMNATAVSTLEQAITVFKSASFDLVLVGAGLESAEETELVESIKKTSPKTPVVLHYGGGSGLLFTEIHQGLSK